jgi:two-component system chemotaxis response regulator CheB
MKRSAARSHRQPESEAPGNDLVTVMVVDDSITTRTVFARLLESDDDFGPVATAKSAEEAIELLKSVAVDVILLDLEMPGMGGLKALPDLIRKSRGARILVVSSLTTDGAEQTLAALELGATDTFPKPSSGGFDSKYRTLLLDRIRALGGGRLEAKGRKRPPATISPPRRPGPSVAPDALAIGASTGGIHALSTLLRALPPRLHIPIFITQHLPASFMTVFARQLTLASGREALIAREGMIARPDQIMIAPGHAHLVLKCTTGRITATLDDKPVANGCLPSVDPMFASLADGLGNRVLAVVLSGMGRDGTEGAARIAKAGGCIYAQDQDSSAVWGMPRSIAEAGIASGVLPPDQISGRIAASMGAASWK